MSDKIQPSHTPSAREGEGGKKVDLIDASVIGEVVDDTPDLCSFCADAEGDELFSTTLPHFGFTVCLDCQEEMLAGLIRVALKRSRL